MIKDFYKLSFTSLLKSFLSDKTLFGGLFLVIITSNKNTFLANKD